MSKDIHKVRTDFTNKSGDVNLTFTTCAHQKKWGVFFTTYGEKRGVFFTTYGEKRGVFFTTYGGSFSPPMGGLFHHLCSL
jgi:hypothetical protein